MPRNKTYYFRARNVRYVVEAPAVEMACLAMVNYFSTATYLVLLNDDPDLEEIIYCPDAVTKTGLVDQDYVEYIEQHLEAYNQAVKSIRRVHRGEKIPGSKIKKKKVTSESYVGNKDWFIDA